MTPDLEQLVVSVNSGAGRAVYVQYVAIRGENHGLSPGVVVWEVQMFEPLCPRDSDRHSPPHSCGDLIIILVLHMCTKDTCTMLNFFVTVCPH